VLSYSVQLRLRQVRGRFTQPRLQLSCVLSQFKLQFKDFGQVTLAKRFSDCQLFDLLVNPPTEPGDFS
jgi:hypothetical protein